MEDVGVDPLMDDFWINEPSNIGQTRFLYGDLDEVPYVVALQADKTERGDIGWVRISGLSVGQFGSHDPDEAALDRQVQFRSAKPFPDLAGYMVKLASAANADLANFEATRRIRRDLDAGIPAQSFEAGRRAGKERRSQEVETAKTIYELVRFTYGRRDTNKFISQYMNCSVRKAEELVREAKKLGRIQDQKKAGDGNGK